MPEAQVQQNTSYFLSQRARMDRAFDNSDYNGFMAVARDLENNPATRSLWHKELAKLLPEGNRNANGLWNIKALKVYNGYRARWIACAERARNTNDRTVKQEAYDEFLEIARYCAGDRRIDQLWNDDLRNHGVKAGINLWLHLMNPEYRQMPLKPLAEARQFDFAGSITTEELYSIAKQAAQRNHRGIAEKDYVVALINDMRVYIADFNKEHKFFANDTEMNVWLKKAVQVIACESGFNPRNANSNSNGSRDFGLFQINTCHVDKLGKNGIPEGDFESLMKNVRWNTYMALLVWKGAGSFRPWNVYKQGMVV